MLSSSTLDPNSPNVVGTHLPDPMADYEEETISYSTISEIPTVIEEPERMGCYNQVIYDDLRLEKTEYAGLQVRPDDSAVHVENMYGNSVFAIIDDDSKAYMCG